jgi:hypothetical protein
MPSTAAACNPTTHCYGLAEWNVAGETSFKGLSAYIESYEDSLNAEESKNIITNEAWVDFKDGYWNESGDVIGCVDIIGCTGSEPRYFWFQNSEKYGYGGVLSSEGPKKSLFEVNDYYYPSTGGWYVQAGSLTGGVNGNPANATGLQIGVESTTNNAKNEAEAINLDWEGAQEKWHYSEWKSGTSHAVTWCESPAASEWGVTKYDQLWFGENWFKCEGTEALALSLPVRSAPQTPASAPTVSHPVNLEEVTAKASNIAASAGDATPESVEIARGVQGTAIEAATPAFSIADTSAQNEWLNDEAFAVVLKGHFTLFTTLLPDNPREPQSTPSGTTLSLVVDAKTDAVSAFNLSGSGQTQPDISAVGPVARIAG